MIRVNGIPEVNGTVLAYHNSGGYNVLIWQVNVQFLKYCKFYIFNEYQLTSEDDLRIFPPILYGIL